MRHKQTCLSLMLILTLTSTLQARTDDWEAVKNLEPGRPYSLKTRHHYYCYFQYANDKELACAVHLPRSPEPSQMIYPRAEVREVREVPDPDMQTHTRIGALAGAGGLGTACAIRCGEGRAITVPIMAGIGALMGGMAGLSVGLGQLFLQRGKLIYKQSTQSAARAPASQGSASGDSNRGSSDSPERSSRPSR